MSNEIAVIDNKNSLAFFNEEKIELIKKTICVGATDAELQLFLMQCERTKLDPFARQIYSVERKSKKKDGSYETKRTTQISIDGFRLIAQRSGQYSGQKPAQWCGRDGIWKDIWTSNDYPYAARVGVLRNDFIEPLYAIAKWDAYSADHFGGIQPMWKKMPDHMLSKVAESLALRKAFPQELSGLYSDDELPINITPQENEGYEENKKLPPSNNVTNFPKNEPKKQMVSTQIEDTKESRTAISDHVKSYALDYKVNVQTQKELLSNICRDVLKKRPLICLLDECVKQTFEEHLNNIHENESAKNEMV